MLEREIHHDAGPEMEVPGLQQSLRHPLPSFDELLNDMFSQDDDDSGFIFNFSGSHSFDLNNSDNYMYDNTNGTSTNDGDAQASANNGDDEPADPRAAEPEASVEEPAHPRAAEPEACVEEPADTYAAASEPACVEEPADARAADARVAVPQASVEELTETASGHDASDSDIDERGSGRVYRNDVSHDMTVVIAETTFSPTTQSKMQTFLASPLLHNVTYALLCSVALKNIPKRSDLMLRQVLNVAIVFASSKCEESKKKTTVSTFNGMLNSYKDVYNVAKRRLTRLTKNLLYDARDADKNMCQKTALLAQLSYWFAVHEGTNENALELFVNAAQALSIEDLTVVFYATTLMHAVIERYILPKVAVELFGERTNKKDSRFGKKGKAISTQVSTTCHIRSIVCQLLRCLGQISTNSTSCALHFFHIKDQGRHCHRIPQDVPQAQQTCEMLRPHRFGEAHAIDSASGKRRRERP